MTQPPYRPSDDHSMRRFALFVAAFVVIVAIGASQPRRSVSSSQSICVCVPTRAGLLLKSAIARTQARSTALFTQ
ncbi:hypothetical protein [Tunturiibacter lichenicola]|uniref:hypothetical protein n=1 Tax=Tunturiibacter lichenicola TaxID=2051959 RepID=UPI0021B4CB12|nr:hypothetical protein [Edaphobacter lichenicola]